MYKIGHGNRKAMLEFVEEDKKDLAKGNFNLQVKMEQVQIEKYGELVYSNFYNVYLVGEQSIIAQFLQTV
jgi:hypothetical protein